MHLRTPWAYFTVTRVFLVNGLCAVLVALGPARSAADDLLLPAGLLNQPTLWQHLDGVNKHGEAVLEPADDGAVAVGGAISTPLAVGDSQTARLSGSLRFFVPADCPDWTSVAVTFYCPSAARTYAIVKLKQPGQPVGRGVIGLDEGTLQPVELRPGSWHTLRLSLVEDILEMTVQADGQPIPPAPQVRASEPQDTINAVGVRTYASPVLVKDLQISGQAGVQSVLDRSQVPEPVFEREPGFVDLYWKAWTLAHTHILRQAGVPQSPYMDEGFAPDTIYIWDTCFMALFCRYSPQQFPGLESLNNFYAPAYGQYPLPMPVLTEHPDNPPLFAWVERDYFQMTGDREHVRHLLKDLQYLQKHYDWFAQVRRGTRVPWGKLEVALQPQPLGFQWNGIASGMDNSPRFAHDPLAVDALAQQGLAARCIAELAERIGDQALAGHWRQEFARVRNLVNQHYWDEQDGFYYDLAQDGKTFVRVRTPASFWPVLAGMASPAQTARMAAHVRDPQDLGGMVPWVTLSRSDPAFDAKTGDYWRGAVWLPTAYMGIRALAENGQVELADSTAEAVLRHMLATYRQFTPHTIWECYSPTEPKPSHNPEGNWVRSDFCGWSALGPISLFIENVLGFHTIDADRKLVVWRLHQDGACGLRRLRFGQVLTDIVADGRGQIDVAANEPYTLIVNGRSFQINVGSQRFAVP